jgi:large subunit ribosomal protein L9
MNFRPQTVNQLQRKDFSIVMNKDHPWVIEPWHIRASLRKAGFHILNDSAIQLPEQKITGPDLAKQGKEFIVWVTINNTEKAKVKCRIHHWSTDPVERLPYVFEHYKMKAEPLFPKPRKESRAE